MNVDQVVRLASTISLNPEVALTTIRAPPRSMAGRVIGAGGIAVPDAEGHGAGPGDVEGRRVNARAVPVCP